MTNEELRVKVAELCGWKQIATELEMKFFGGPQQRETDEAVSSFMLPDYPNDLNACAEFEKTLTDHQLRIYGDQLQEILRWYIVGYIEQDYRANFVKLAKIACATAEQRCRAFVATMEAR